MEPTPYFVDDESRKIVWILGAGFSKPLGAPLLRDLLSPKASIQIQDAYLGTPVTSAAHHIAGIYDFGKTRGQWSNAEEFLERLDLAMRGKTPRKILLGWSRRFDEVKSILTEDMLAERHRDGLLMLASECCLFLKDIDPEMERFAPYRSWAAELNGSDAVLTFNYDRVVDLVQPSGRYHIPLPQELRDNNDPSEQSSSTVVLKMHGSVDWVVEDGSVLRKGPEAVLGCSSAEGIAL